MRCADSVEGATAKLNSCAISIAFSSAADEVKKNAALPGLCGVAQVDVKLSHVFRKWCPLGLDLIVRPCPALVDPLGQFFFELKKPPEGGR